MRILLDTHVLLWAVGMSKRLPASTRQLLEDTENDVYYSAASLWLDFGHFVVEMGCSEMHPCTQALKFRRVSSASRCDKIKLIHKPYRG